MCLIKDQINWTYQTNKKKVNKLVFSVSHVVSLLGDIKLSTGQLVFTEIIEDKVSTSSHSQREVSFNVRLNRNLHIHYSIAPCCSGTVVGNSTFWGQWSIKLKLMDYYI